MNRSLVFGVIGASLAFLTKRTPSRQGCYGTDRLVGWIIVTKNKTVFIDVCDTFLLPADWFNDQSEPQTVNAERYAKMYTIKNQGARFPVYADSMDMPVDYYRFRPLLECPKYDATTLRNLRPEKNIAYTSGR